MDTHGNTMETHGNTMKKLRKHNENTMVTLWIHYEHTSKHYGNTMESHENTMGTHKKIMETQ